MMGTQNTVIHGPASRKPLSGTNKPTILIHCEKRKKERKKGEDVPRREVKAPERNSLVWARKLVF